MKHHKKGIQIVSDFVNSHEWRRVVSEFLVEECTTFCELQQKNYLKNKNIDEFSLEQYAMFQDFQKIIEQTLKESILDKGIDESQFVDLCQELVHSECKGPKDESLKTILEKLLIFHDFTAFANTMQQLYKNNKKQIKDQNLDLPQEEHKESDECEHNKMQQCYWKCQVCNYLNDTTATTCSVCATSPKRQIRRRWSFDSSAYCGGGSGEDEDSYEFGKRLSNHSNIIKRAMTQNQVQYCDKVIETLPNHEKNAINKLFDAMSQNYGTGYITEKQFEVLVERTLETNMDTLSDRSRYSFVYIQDCFRKLSQGQRTIDRNQFFSWFITEDNGYSICDEVQTEFIRLRECLGEIYDIFLGFTYAQWLRARETLNNVHIQDWNNQHVMLFFATHEDLRVVRKHIRRCHFEDVDGETLLNLSRDDWEAKGIKSYHIAKIVRCIRATNDHESRQQQKAASNDGRSSPRRVATTSRSLHKRFRKGTVIGQGSFGTVYMGLDDDVGCLAAIKVVDMSHTKVNLSKIQSEIDMLKRLEHENIVKYLGAHHSTENHELTIYTEWIPGGSIHSIVKKFGRLSHEVTRMYTTQIVQGLDYLHSHNIAHLDIKPANILVSDLGIVKIADFGSSKVMMGEQGVHSSDNGQIAIVGTPYYMAPEIIRTGRVDKSLDIWALGGTIQYMITGEHPWAQSFSVDTSEALILAIGRANAAPPLHMKLPKELASFLARCLEVYVPNRASIVELSMHPYVVKSANELFQHEESPNDTTLTPPPKVLDNNSNASTGTDSFEKGGIFKVESPAVSPANRRPKMSKTGTPVMRRKQSVILFRLNPFGYGGMFTPLTRGSQIRLYFS